jgi:hypothetical protein
MTEKLNIHGKEVWVVVEPHIPVRANPNIIPTEYFKVFYDLKEPGDSDRNWITDTGKEPKLFESPVAALEYANEKLLDIL